MVHVTGFPDGPPVHTGFSHADTTTALMGAFAVAAALVRRHDEDFEGEWIDLALFETLFRLIEWQVIFYDQFGVSPARAGNTLEVAPGAVVNTYLSADDTWITVTSATPRSVLNIARLLGEPLDDYRTAEQQSERKLRLDELLSKWISDRKAADALDAMTDADVVASRIYSAEDIMNDRTYAEREDVITVADPDLGEVRMQAVVPKMHSRPGAVWRVGPRLGEDNDLVYGEWLGVSAEHRADLTSRGII